MERTCWHHSSISSQTLSHTPSPHTIPIAGKSESDHFWVTSHTHILQFSPSHTLSILLAYTDELFTCSHFLSSSYTTVIHTQLPPSFYLFSSLCNDTKVKWWHFGDMTRIVQIRTRWNSFHSFSITPLLRFSVSTMKLPLLFSNHH